jgi:hypothetical protein
MADEELQRRVEECRKDYKGQVGHAFEHFFCPILRCDEPTDLCRGHVIPEKLKSCNAWVPQRADVDNFYGWLAEAEFIGIVQDHGKDVLQLWLDPQLRRKHRPRLESEGQQLEAYFPKSHSGVSGQSPVTMVGEDGSTMCHFVIKASPEEIDALAGRKMELVVDRDYRPAVIASVLKAAHLSLFKMLGYRHVFSPAGLYLGDILGRFYREHKGKSKKELEGPLEEYFRQFEGMVTPIVIQDQSLLKGTDVDNRVLACLAGSGGMFSLSVVVKAADHEFCVFLPGDDGKTIDTYFSFLKEPPGSTAVKLLQFVPSDGSDPSHWATSDEEPFRIPFHQKLPEGQA